ncbi:MAG: hypothetical protein FGM14_10675 [Flavobacteriales bacterium]|nr:hypothetical protein [Flavobacteriales bacterium]
MIENYFLFNAFEKTIETRQFETMKTENIQKLNSNFLFLKINEFTNVIEQIKQESSLIGNEKIGNLCLILQKLVLKKEKTKTAHKPISIKIFKKRISQIHSNLNDTEILFFLLIIQQTSINDIATLTGLTSGTVRVYKVKLKSKLGLKPKEKIVDYLLKVYYK